MFELVGEQREKHYEQRLLLGLPWYCNEAPAAKLADGAEGLTWDHTV